MFWAVPSIRGGGIDSPRPASQRAAALILTAALLTGAAFPAFADTYYIEDGNITISAGTQAGTNKVEQGGTLKSENDKDTIVTNRNTDIASSNTVTIEANGKDDKVEVTLDNVNIKAETDSGSALTSKGDVTLTLKGDNHLTGGNGSSQGLTSHYGSYGISSSGNLTITGGEKDSLTVQGGDGSLGGGGISINGDVTISGGTVNATGGNGGGGGAGSYGSGIHSSGSVTISGGTVTANGGNSGGGNYRSGGDGIQVSKGVTISGGTVTANGGDGSGNNSYGGTVNTAGGNGSTGGNGIYGSKSIDLSGSLELTAEAGKGGKGTQSNGKALSQNGKELDLNDIKDKLDPGADITTKDADSKVIDHVSIPRPVEPEKPVIPEESSSSSDGGSATPA